MRSPSRISPNEFDHQVRLLRLGKASYQKIVDIIEDSLLILDEEGTILFANKMAAHNLTGSGSSPIVGGIISDFLPQGQANSLKELYQDTIATGQPSELDVMLTLRGVDRWLHTYLRPFSFGSQKIPAAALHARDITERKQAAVLKRTVSLLKSTLQSTADGILVVDTNGIFIEHNDQFARLWRIPKAILDAHDDHKALEFVLDQLTYPDQFISKVRELYASPEAVSSDVLEFKDGRVFERYSQPLQIDGVTIGRVWCFRDVTERRRAEEKTRQSEEFIRGILDTVDEGFIVIDQDYRVLTANKAYCSQVGDRSKDIIGQHCYEVSHNFDRPCFTKGEACASQRAFETGRTQTALQHHKDARGNILLVEIKAFPIKDASGAITSVIETSNNITERHLLEEERLKTQKLESIGTFAGGIAHDFNNLLTGVLGYVSLLRTRTDSAGQRYIAEAEKAIDQARSLTQQLLTFSKGGEPVKKPIHILPTVTEAIGFGLSGRNIQYEIVVDEDLPAVEADQGQIKQVIQNIVINAAEAMAQGGVVHVCLRTEHVPEDTVHLQRGQYVAIRIKDFGTGIPRDHLRSIFDPYFTTKQQGSGLGLATSFSIVKKHGGIIDVVSEVGRGTQFTVYLPASRKPVEATRANSPIVPGQGKILVLEDEQLLRQVCNELLHTLGYKADMVEIGEDAVSKYDAAMKSSSPYDAVILDLTIRGGMGGKQTIGILKTLDPEVRGIVSSGYSEDPVVANFQHYGFAARLSKPYTIQELSATLQEVMRHKHQRANLHGVDDNQIAAQL